MSNESNLQADLQYISLKDIYIPTTAQGLPRERKKSESTVEDNAYSIENMGLDNVPTIFLANPINNHKLPYELGDGLGRYLGFEIIDDAAKTEEKIEDESGAQVTGLILKDGRKVYGNFNGKKFDGKMPVIIKQQFLTKTERMTRGLAMNLIRKGMQDKESIKLLVELQYENPSWGPNELSQATTLAPSQIQKLFKTVKLPDYAKTALALGKDEKGALTLVNAVTLSDVMPFCTDEELKEFFDKATGVYGQKNTKLRQETGTHQANVEKERKEAKKDQPKVDKEVFLVKSLYKSRSEAEEHMDILIEKLKQSIEEKASSVIIAFNEGALSTALYLLSRDEKSVAIQESDFAKKKLKKKDDAKINADKRDKQKDFDQFYTLIGRKQLKLTQIPVVYKKEYTAYAAERKAKEASESVAA